MTAPDRPSQEPAPSPAHESGGSIKRLYWRAFDDDLTGMAAMVAYNLLLSIFPLALLSLFIASQVLQSEQLQTSVFEDLRRLFPSAAESTLLNVLDSIRTATTGLGIVALVASIWIGSSFWGALDTAFCRIYHLECRPWLKQKRFGVAMLAVSLAFIAATVAVPALQSIIVAGAEDLPFGLSEVRVLVFAATLVAGIALLFVILSVIYWTVPHGRLPWRAIWPGALGATLAIAVVDYAFPAYLSRISTLAGLGTSLIFIVIVLLWFYALAIIILAGAEINALRLASANEPAAAATAAETREDGQPAPGSTDVAAPRGRAAGAES
ncbi:MAG: YihY/virulence factor BrkB family protein [Thermoleophilaceae bacterium]|nr:YihY/virulence factor BrkB family protein [Thermoleophilaceae bacterium]